MHLFFRRKYAIYCIDQEIDKRSGFVLHMQAAP